VFCAERGENLSAGDRVLCAERGKKFSSGRYRAVC